MLHSLFLFAACASSAFAGTVTYNWDITWVNAAPDGVSRPVIGINGQWPCPIIKATAGDQVVVNLNNKLGNETTGLHFHGIAQKGTPEMDGPSQVTQCPIPPGSSFTYSFTVDSPGTYWYHSHNMGQYPDGLRGPLIVEDPSDPYAGQYDDEFILTTSDWYDQQSVYLIPAMLNPSNVNILPPFPDAGLFNDSNAPAIFNFEAGKTYKIRVISMSALGSTMLAFDSHTMDIIEIDGVYTKKTSAEQIRVAPAQRYTFLMTAKTSNTKNYAFTGNLDVNRDYTQAGDQWGLNMTGYLIYNPVNITSTATSKVTSSNSTTTSADQTASSSNLPGPYTVGAWTPIDDTTLTPLDNEGLLANPTKKITLNFNFGFDSLGIPRAYMNNVTYVSQKVPTLYTVLTSGDESKDPVIYGQVNPFVVKYNDVVELTLNNLDIALHPFHLHGHQFQICERPASGSGTFSGSDSGFPATPARRDTVNVNGNSYVVIRFKADNPGVQLFHCHIEWHVEMGLTATIIEARKHIQKTVTIPQDHLAVCKAMGLPTAGNAAGNTQNLTDLSGANTMSPNPDNGALYTGSSTKARSVRSKLSPLDMHEKWNRIYQ